MNDGRKEAALAEGNIAAHLERMAELAPQRAALVISRAEGWKDRLRYESISFASLAQESAEAAFGLRAHGILPHQRVVLMVPPSREFFVLVFALFRLGAVPVLIDPGMGARNIKACIERVSPDAFIGVGKAQLARILLGWGKGQLRRIVQVGTVRLPGAVGYGTILRVGRAQIGAAFGEPLAAADGPAAILFTSGSTGTPKGAVYGHAQFQAQLRLLQALYDIQPGEIDLGTFPLFSLFGPALGMTALVPDMDFTRPAEVRAERLFRLAADHAATNLFGSPALLRRLAMAAQASTQTMQTARSAFRHLRRAISAGAPVPPAVLEAFTPLLSEGVQVYTPYGATESLPIASLGSTEILRETAAATRDGKGVCVGRVAPETRLRIMRISKDAYAEWRDDLEVARGELGEIVVEGPQVTSHYFAHPEATRLAKMRHPVSGRILHRMGDLGYLDEKERLWFCGRKAHRVYTMEGPLDTIPCEAIFNAHPKVSRSALVGRGEEGVMQPVVFIETKERLGANAKRELAKQLLTLAAAHPLTAAVRELRFIGALPVDTRHNSKIFREKLKVRADRELMR